jgi:NADH dehydrogenase
MAMQGLVTVFGGSGFIGRATVRALAKAGWRVRAAQRNPGRGYRLRMLGDVGQIEVVQANLRDDASIRRALDGAEVVVNLVGVLYERGRQKFALHSDGAANLAGLAKAAGVKRFVQMSALGADANGDSDYARTKAEGEAAVRAVYPNAAIVRPSVVCGAEDAFFNKLGEMAAIFPVLPLPAGGKTLFSPVFVDDVAAAIAKLAGDDKGGIYELAGPATHSFRELAELVLRETGRKRPLLPLPAAATSLLGVLGDIAAFTPVAPPLTSDQARLLGHDNVVSGAHPGLAELGIAATPIEAIVTSYLYRYRKGGQYADLLAAAQA